MGAAEADEGTTRLLAREKDTDDGPRHQLRGTEECCAAWPAEPQGHEAPLCRQHGPLQQYRRPVLAVATVLAAVAVAAFAVVSAVGPFAGRPGGIVALAAAGAGQHRGCAKADVEDCSVSQCCLDVGHQCYQKAPGWAVCKTSCDQNRMREDDPDHERWSCKPLGERRRCANATENCAEFGCCAVAGAQCYAKDSDQAVCLESCDSQAMTKHDPKNDAWSCKPIGQRNFRSKCAWAGEDCTEGKCCNNKGFVCTLQDKSSATCTQTIKKDRWTSENVPVPKDLDGKVLGGGRSEFEADPAEEGEPTAGSSLFCLMVYLPNSTEEILMRLAEKNQASIFSCDESMTVHAWKSESDGADLDVEATSTILNTDVFINAWRLVFQDGRYAEHDWTVKADPDCVFFASRLRSHLAGLRAPQYTPIYLKNNDMELGLGNKGFLGAIEVFSTAAMQTYFANSEGCQRTLGTNCGEDTFFKACMDALGVGFMIDPSIYAPDYNPQVCNKVERVAFHPLKVASEWQCCVDLVKGVKRKVSYGQCDAPENVNRSWLVQS